MRRPLAHGRLGQAVRPCGVLACPPRLRAGFTLAETLATLVVVTLVSGIAVTCVVMATRQLSAHDDVAAARMLREGLVTAVRRELALSRDASFDASGVLTGYAHHDSAAPDGVERRSLGTDEAGHVMVTRRATDGGVVSSEPLVASDGYDANASPLRATLVVRVVPPDGEGSGGYYHVEIGVWGLSDAALAEAHFDVAPLSGPATLVRADG